MRFVFRIFACMIVFFLYFAGDVDAKKAILKPVKTAEISDPAESGDIRLLLFFELPGEVTNSKAIVDFALLKCEAEVEGATVAQIEIFPLTTQWDDRSDVSWNNPWESSGGDYSEVYMTSNVILRNGVGQRGISIDVTELVRDWQIGDLPNRGIILRLSGDDMDDRQLRYQVDEHYIELEVYYSSNNYNQD